MNKQKTKILEERECNLKQKKNKKRAFVTILSMYRCFFCGQIDFFSSVLFSLIETNTYDMNIDGMIA